MRNLIGLQYVGTLYYKVQLLIRHVLSVRWKVVLPKHWKPNCNGISSFKSFSFFCLCTFFPPFWVTPNIRQLTNWQKLQKTFFQSSNPLYLEKSELFWTFCNFEWNLAFLENSFMATIKTLIRKWKCNFTTWTLWGIQWTINRVEKTIFEEIKCWNFRKIQF